MATSRQLAAIMFTDIVGYTSLMGRDEEKAVEIIKKNRSIHQRLIKQFNGKWLKEMGDGILASFPTISDAVYCAGSIQKEVIQIEGLNLRIGIHQGEILVQKEDILGDGVNIASRIQGQAEAGQILVSEGVYNNIKNRTGINLQFERDT
jgi:adenylate cyclase